MARCSINIPFGVVHSPPPPPATSILDTNIYIHIGTIEQSVGRTMPQGNSGPFSLPFTQINMLLRTPIVYYVPIIICVSINLNTNKLYICFNLINTIQLRVNRVNSDNALQFDLYTYLLLTSNSLLLRGITFCVYGGDRGSYI